MWKGGFAIRCGLLPLDPSADGEKPTTQCIGITNPDEHQDGSVGFVIQLRGRADLQSAVGYKPTTQRIGIANPDEHINEQINEQILNEL